MTCASLIRQFTKRQKRRLFVWPIKRDLAKRVDSGEARGCKEAESDLAASSGALIVKLLVMENLGIVVAVVLQHFPIYHLHRYRAPWS